MINVIVVTPKGELINKSVAQIVVSSDFGQFGILTNRLPIISKISKGYIKIESDIIEYVSIVNGVLDFDNNEATIVAQDAAVSTSLEEANNIIENNLLKINRSNKIKNIDFVEAEKELVKNIQKMKSAHLK